ncbi:MAG: hypothetical protein CK529_05150 [Rhodospirillaceae bacterium]|nr:MAG: hypothetical protein CK529_05150 [Rhodospirillaceae bacterium]
MDIKRSPLPAVADRPKIQKYGAGRFTISGQVYTSGVFVLPHQALSWPATDLASLSDEAIDLLLAHTSEIDVCLLGCGPKTLPIPATLRTRFKAAGFRADVMDTGSACRTYNVLMSEGRAVAAALIAI